MGVTGSGKTFTMANVIQQRAAARRSSSRTTRRSPPSSTASSRSSSRTTRSLLRQLLRLLPARGLHPAARHLHRERRLDQRGDRPPAAGHDQLAGQPPRRDHRRQRVVHLRLGLAGRLQGDDGRPSQWATSIDRDEVLAQAGRHPVRAQRHRLRPRQVPRARRLRRALAVATRSSPTASSSGATRSSSSRSSTRPRGEVDRQARAGLHLPGQALRAARGAHPQRGRRHPQGAATSGSSCSSRRASCSKPSG